MKAAGLRATVLWWAGWLAHLSSLYLIGKNVVNEPARQDTGKLDSNNWARRNLMRESRVESEVSRRGRGGGGYGAPLAVSCRRQPGTEKTTGTLA